MNKKFKILVVDDNQTNRLFIKSFLEDIYTLEEASNGKDAISLTRVFEPDLILMDVEMPIMDGFDACEALQSMPKYKQIPIIFITAQDDSAYEVVGLGLGAIDYITKPVNKNVLLTRIKIQLDLLEARRERDEKIEELEKMVRIFQLKFSNISPSTNEEKKEEEPETVLHQEDDYVFDEHWSELEDIEGDMDAIINTMFLQGTIKKELLEDLSSMIVQYSKILRFYPVFNILGMGLENLSNTIKEGTNELDSTEIETVLTYFESLFFTLKHWRTQVFNKELENLNLYDASMLNDIEMIGIAFKGDLNTIENEVEFF